MEPRLPRVRRLLERARCLREVAQEQVAAAADELARLVAQREETRLEAKALGGFGGDTTAAARVRLAEYQRALERREGELERLVEQGAQRLARERRSLRRTWRDVEVWERLTARLERIETRRLTSVEQEQIDQYARGRQRPRVWD
ncbi:MAG: hypothetical protein ACYC63_11925 [Armatimonadota bacterium]